MPIFITIVIVSIVAALIISFYPKKTKPKSPSWEDIDLGTPTPPIKFDTPVSGETELTPIEVEPVITNVPKVKSKNTAKVKSLAKMEAKKKVKKTTDKNKTKKSTKK
jgi:hypothetical protein